MSQPKHTPGPWNVDGWNVYSESAKSLNERPCSYFAVATVSDASGSLVRFTIEKEEASANAALIAAAPEMYEVLKALIEYAPHATDCNGGCVCPIGLADVVIAKAEGRE